MSLPKHENLTTGKKILWKRGEIAGAISPIFHKIFNISLTSRVQLHIYLLNVVVQIKFFLNSANLICRGTDISKYFRESLEIRDNESQLYVFLMSYKTMGMLSVLIRITSMRQF